MHNKKYPNLKSWKKGQSGNPAGHKHGSKNVSTIVCKLLEQDVVYGVLGGIPLSKSVKGKSTSYTQVMVLVMIQKKYGIGYRTVQQIASNFGIQPQIQRATKGGKVTERYSPEQIDQIVTENCH